MMPNLDVGFYIRFADGSLYRLLPRSVIWCAAMDEIPHIEGNFIVGECLEEADTPYSEALEEFLSRLKVTDEAGGNT